MMIKDLHIVYVGRNNVGSKLNDWEFEFEVII